MQKIKTYLSSAKCKFDKNWTSLKAQLFNVRVLVAMQLKEKLDLSFLKSKKETTFKVIYSFLAIAVITAFIYLGFYASTLLGILSLTSRLPVTVIVFLFTLMQLLSILSCTLGLTKSLYFSGDNASLLTLPVRPNNVFFSKIVVFYVFELKKNLTFLVPMFLAFGLINGLSPLFYLILLLSFFFVSLIPVILGAILSIPTMWVSMLLRNLQFLQFGLFLGGAAVVIKVAFDLVARIPPNLNLIQQFATYYWEIQNFLNAFSETFAPFTAITQMIVGTTQYFVHIPITSSTFVTFGLLLAILVLGSLFVFLVARPLFFNMSSKPFEYKKRVILIPKKNYKNSKYLSSLKKEVLINLRTPSLLLTNISAIFVLPLAIFLLNKVFASMDTRLVGQHMSLSFNLLIILLILLSNNSQVASVFSSEGAAMYLLKTKPAPLKSNMMAKLTLNLVLSTLSILATALILKSVVQLSLPETMFVFLIATLVNMSHILWSAQLDIVSPQYRFYHNGVHNSTNPNETKSTILAFTLAFLFFGISLFLFFENYAVAWQKLLGIALVFAAARIFLFFANAKVYFKEM